MKNHEIVVAGAGRVGSKIAEMMGAFSDYSVVCIDKVQPSEPIPGVTFKKIDVTDMAALQGVLTNKSAVLSALPYYLNISIAKVAKQCGNHYFDLTESVETTNTIREIAADANSAFVPQCGIAPGYICILANGLTKDFDTMKSLSLRAGCLPQSPTTGFGYNLMWSIDGVVHECCEPCPALRNGKHVMLNPMEEGERLIHDGVEYEAFTTSGCIGSLCETWEGRIESLEYKTIRYPGHFDLMRFLLNDLRFREKQKELRDHLDWSLPVTERDILPLQVSATGMRNGRFYEKVVSQTFKSGSGSRSMAIETTTAAGICVMADLVLNNKLPQKGFIKQEEASLEDFLANRFATVYAQSFDS